MSNAIQLYSNQDFSVRTTQDADGKVWFVAKDVAEALEYPENSVKQVNNLFGAVPDCWKGHKQIMTVTRGEQEMLCLTEQGVYFFLGRSDKQKALPYQMWIAGEVVPDIMHTGGYSTKQTLSEDLKAVQVVLEPAGITGNQLSLALDRAYKTYTGRSALEAAGVQLIAPTQNQFLTPTDIGKQFGLSAIRVNQVLAGAGYQHKIADKWEPLEPAKPYAVMQDTGKVHSNGTPIRQLKWDSSILDVFEELLQQDEVSA